LVCPRRGVPIFSWWLGMSSRPPEGIGHGDSSHRRRNRIELVF
jgi:hypothetical protein